MVESAGAQLLNGISDGQFSVTKHVLCLCTSSKSLILTTDVVSKSGILFLIVDPGNGQMNCCSKVEVAALSVLSFGSSACLPQAVSFSFVTKQNLFSNTINPLNTELNPICQ